MNKHSIKVPRLYKVSAQVAKEVSQGIGSIKSLVYEKQKKHPNIKAIFALVSTVFQKTDELETLLKRSQLFVKEPKLEPWLAKILIVELLWGKKKLPGQSKPENTVRAYEQIFKAHLSDDISQEIKAPENDAKPRYVRINALLSNLSDAIDAFREDGWVLDKFLDKTDYKEYLEKIVSLNNDSFMVDIHVPNLLVFPPKTTFYNHPAYKNGFILLQDKASCLPVHILNPPPGSTVLDMCAAPGMKTTHLAAVLNDQGIVYATERNPKRYETLSKIVESSGAKCVKTFNKDILECSKEDFPGVEYILVDPSCSGTGMADRPQEPQENILNSDRLSSLTGFQIKILRHALTKFPDVKKVVYSTCSILPEENEDVVRQVLETNYIFKLVPAQNFVGNTWHNFGSSDFGDIGKFCLYAKPNEDRTNGFFVAVFERLKEGEENQFFNKRIFDYKKYFDKKMDRKQRQFEEQKENNEKVPKKKQKENKTKHIQNQIEASNNAQTAEDYTKRENKKNNNNKIVEELNNFESESSLKTEKSDNYVKTGDKRKKKMNEYIAEDQELVITNKKIEKETTEFKEVNNLEENTIPKKKKKMKENLDNNLKANNVVKKKKKKVKEVPDERMDDNSDEIAVKKKKKKKKIKEEPKVSTDDNLENADKIVNEKKKKVKHEPFERVNDNLDQTAVKKKKKIKEEPQDNLREKDEDNITKKKKVKVEPKDELGNLEKDKIKNQNRKKAKEEPTETENDSLLDNIDNTAILFEKIRKRRSTS